MQSLGKRKRSEEEDIEKVFAKYWGELHHALKTAKGFERQRQSKRLHDRSTPQDKKARIENEIVVLKSLDLYQAAHAHLCFSLLRIKRIAECPNLPEAVKRGVSKPVLTEEERTALHNVTSALCARQEVRTVTEKAIVGICKSMGIEPPEKKGKKGRKEKDESKTEDGDKKMTKDEKEEEKKDAKVEKKIKETEKDKDDKAKEKTKTKEKPAKKEAVVAQDSDDDEEELLKDEEEEKVLSKYDDLLGGSSSEESNADDEDDERFASKAAVKKRSIAKELDPMEITDDEEGGYGDDDCELDPMEITDDDEEAEDGDSEQNSDSEDEFEGFSDSDGDEGQPEQQSSDSNEIGPEEDDEDSESENSGIDAGPSKKKSKSSSTSSNPKLQNFTMDSTFLPTLMGGYISGSESASDVDVAPARKNRRGQRARQAIWEKKFKEEAKHLKKLQNARDAGWDTKRGAVESDGKPWKKGSLLDIKNKGKGGNEEGGEDKKEGGAAAAGRGGDRGRGGGRGGRGGAAGRGGRDNAPAAAAAAAPPARAPKKRDDSGPLHPSWEAKKKAKEKEKLSAPFQGKKITFD